jgi:hypothetical protein
MTWAGAGVLWTMSGGVPRSRLLGGGADAAEHRRAGQNFSFVQISDSHIGFAKPPNLDTPASRSLTVSPRERRGVIMRSIRMVCILLA